MRKNHSVAKNIGKTHGFGVAMFMTAVVAEFYVVVFFVSVDKIGDVTHLSEVFKE